MSRPSNISAEGMWTCTPLVAACGSAAEVAGPPSPLRPPHFHNALYQLSCICPKVFSFFPNLIAHSAGPLYLSPHFFTFCEGLVFYVFPAVSIHVPPNTFNLSLQAFHGWLSYIPTSPSRPSFSTPSSGIQNSDRCSFSSPPPNLSSCLRFTFWVRFPQLESLRILLLSIYIFSGVLLSPFLKRLQPSQPVYMKARISPCLSSYSQRIGCF